MLFKYINILWIFIIQLYNLNHVFCRSFTIDYEKNCFLKDGKPFQYYSGSMHYFRTQPQYWRSRLTAMKDAGLDAVQTYIEWSSIEIEKGNFDFTGINNVFEFIKIANEVGLLVILRPGPYICAERDLGGFPTWLKWEKNIELRTFNQIYLNAIESFYSVLLPRLVPFLYENNGPIIMIQVENEFGSVHGSNSTDAMKYKLYLRDLFYKYIGRKTLLFTTDGFFKGYVNGGYIPEVYPTIDFGTGDNITEAVIDYRQIVPKGPLVNSEFYTGWLDHWSESHQTVNISMIMKALEEMHNYGFNVNFYMFHGGTNFGFTTGANIGKTYTPDPTSYDYDAPITEAGDLTEKYFAIKNFIAKVRGKKIVPETKKIVIVEDKMKLDNISLLPIGNIFDSDFSSLSPTYNSKYPKSFEDVKLSNGFLLYTTELMNITEDFVLNITKLHDRALVYVDRVYSGKLSRTLNISEIVISVQKGSKPRYLQILVENQGRINYGSEMNENKGILSDVLINGKVQNNWNHKLFYANWNKVQEYLRARSKIQQQQKFTLNKQHQLPTFFYGNFKLSSNITVPQSTYIDFEKAKFQKGILFINNNNLGRYWPLTGPQRTLYIPGVFLKTYPEDNEIIILELQNCECQSDPNGCLIDFVDKPQINSPIWPD